MNETAKTSLLIIATIFTGVGAAEMTKDVVAGTILLLLAAGVLILRGFLKANKLI